ncbi:MAG: hypothetical protein MUD08_10915 [Cytophagales bacterium]|nr:hypothetical protein [Cytophagales bacterium]
MKVICIDDTHKPNEVQQKNWVKKGKEYTALRLYRNPLSGEQFFALEEVQPDPPYAKKRKKWKRNWPNRR